MVLARLNDTFGSQVFDQDWEGRGDRIASIGQADGESLIIDPECLLEHFEHFSSRLVHQELMDLWKRELRFCKDASD
jgi:hypothetical protein